MRETTVRLISSFHRAESPPVKPVATCSPLLAACWEPTIFSKMPRGKEKLPLHLLKLEGPLKTPG